MSIADDVSKREAKGLAEVELGETLPAHCLCGKVQFHITRPDASSEIVTAELPEEFIPPSSHVGKANGGRRWWIQDNGTKYIAGLCACNMCRRMAGFEVQPWAYVPQSNIFLHVPVTLTERASSSGTCKLKSMLPMVEFVVCCLLIFC
jgi:hypothetical protein